MTRAVYDECHHHGAAEEAETKPGTGLVCADCGREIKSFDYFHTVDGELVCEDCLKGMTAHTYITRFLGIALKLGIEMELDK